jgi:hypothetical protein
LNRGLIASTCGVLAIALLAAGCGGGDEETESTASLTKAQFIKQADGICKAGEEEIEVKFESFAKEHKLSDKTPPSHKESEEAANTILIPAIAGEVKEIRGLGAPSGESEQVDELLSSVEAALDGARKDPVKFIESEGEGEFAKANRMAREYGLKVCGSES